MAHISFELSTIRFDKESFQRIIEYILEYSSAVTSVEEVTTGAGMEASITQGTLFEIGTQSGSIINMLIFLFFSLSMSLSLECLCLWCVSVFVPVC